MIERLGRLGYHVVAHEPRQPGEFRPTPAALDVFLREQPDLHVSPTLVRLVLDQTRISDVRLMPQDVPSFPVALEPQLISGLRGESLLKSDFTRMLDCSFEKTIELAEDASRRGWISLKRVGQVVEVLFPNLITAQEMEWLREQN